MSLDIDFVDNYYIARCEDVETIRQYKGKKVEVKTDDTNYSRTNLVFELVSNSEKGTKGWALTTECNVIVYVFPKKDKVYILDGKNTRAFIESIQNDKSYKTTTRDTLDTYGNRFYSSVAVLVSIEELIRRGLVVQVFTYRTQELLKDNRLKN